MRRQIYFILTSSVLLYSTILGQDYAGTKIYINPGHGGNDPANDRFIPETGFWESESNLTKGLYLRDLLESLNAIVYMSRTQNREEDDLPLSQIDADANANNVDLFHSIHSNAFNEMANYTLLLYKETNGQPVDPLSRDLGNIITDEIFRVHRTTAKYNRGDYSFLGYNLGVLRYLNYNIMRGTLSEGSFHDYLPESFRLMSNDYRKHESVALLRAFNRYYNLESLPHGMIAGIVRAKDKQVTYAYNYNSVLPNDKKRALNNVKVTLLPLSKIYITDNNHNGFFMFDSLAPGNYQMIVEAGEYYADTLEVSVLANTTSFADAFLVENPDKAPFIYSYDPSHQAQNISTYASIQVNFSRSMNTESTQASFSILPENDGTFQWTNENQVMTFRPQNAYQTDTDYFVSISGAALSQFGVPLAEPLQFSFHTSTDHLRPRIISRYPIANMDSVFTHTEIEIGFDSEMRAEVSESAFLMEPDVAGDFSWQDNNSKLIFKPFDPLQPETYYTVNLTKNAQNYYGIGPQNDFAFIFRTRKLNRIEVVETYPFSNAENVSPETWCYILLDRIIDESTVSNLNFAVQSRPGKTHAVRYLETTTVDDHSRIIFKPQPALETNSEYILWIYPGISTLSGLMVQDTVAISFKTEKANYASGLILDGFENLDFWLDPAKGPYTKGIDTVETRVRLDSRHEMGGNYRAELTYIFSDSNGGVVHLYNPQRISLGANANSDFGIWIFGDYSFNRLELWFDHDIQSNAAVVIDTVNWYGWKLIRFPLNQINPLGEIFFHSIVLTQTPGGFRSSQIYFDDVQIDVVVRIDDENRILQNIPTEFQLYQNHPNPFNSLTTIYYELADDRDVDLSIYNLLGQKVITLVSQKQLSGTYRVEWNAAGFSSGLYFYCLESGEIVKTKKMILMR